MRKERVKQINTDAIIKVQNFLSEVQIKVKNNRKFSIYKLARDWKISGSIGTMCVELGYVIKGDEQGEYKLDSSFNDSRKLAKFLIESLRLKKFKQETDKSRQKLIDSGELVPVSKDNLNSDKEYVPKIEANTGREIESMLKRILSNNHQINNPSLFSEQEKEFDDKLKIACAIAGGLVYNWKEFDFIDVDYFTEKVIIATDNLYSKLKNNK